jgi:fumarate hydratase subunit beta
MTKVEKIRLETPLTVEIVKSLKAGDNVLLSGDIFTARDAAHKRLVEAIFRGIEAPLPLKDQIIYYTGPTPAPPGRPIGSCGPTTSSRMDSFTPALLAKGLRGMIGKGDRSREVVEAMKKFSAVYFIATGGAGALISQYVKEAKVIAYPDLGPEAIYHLKVIEFPIIVGIDFQGKNVYHSVSLTK